MTKKNPFKGWQTWMTGRSYTYRQLREEMERVNGPRPSPTKAATRAKAWRSAFHAAFEAAQRYAVLVPTV